MRAFYSICLVVFLFCIRASVAAQDSSIPVQRSIYLRSSFFYDFPESFGTTAGFDMTLSSKAFLRINKKGIEKKRTRDLFLSADMGFYRYKLNNTGILLFAGIGKRFAHQTPFYFEASVNVGGLRTFYDGIVYTVDENGNVKTNANFGRYYALAGISATTGWNLEKSKMKWPFTFQLRPALWLQFPYNSFTLPHFSVDATVKYRLSNLKSTISQKQIRKP